jgi:hypothetical protein
MTRQQRRAAERAHMARKPQRTPPSRTPGASDAASALPRWLGWLALGSVALAVVVLFGLWPQLGVDLWMHRVVGRWTWEHGGPPLVDHFSFMTTGEPFIAHSWLAGLVFYLIEPSLGSAWFVGFMGLRCVLVSFALAFAVATARLLQASWSALLLLAPLVLGLAWARFEVRPMLFTSAFLVVELYLLISVHTGRRSWRWLWVLPPMYALWINLHAGWPQGMVMLGDDDA